MHRPLKSLLPLLLLGFCSVGMAGPATRLMVNCISATTPPPYAHCFDHVAGQPFQFWVLAVDAGGFVATGYRGTVHITSSDPLAILPPDYTFTAADGGMVHLPFTFNSIPTSQVPAVETITATDTASGLSGTGGFLVTLPPAVPAPTLGATALLALSSLLGLLALLSLYRARSSVPTCAPDGIFCDGFD